MLLESRELLRPHYISDSSQMDDLLVNYNENKVRFDVIWSNVNFAPQFIDPPKNLH